MSLNTRDDMERIDKHVHMLPSFVTTPLPEWVNIIANKLDLYLAEIERLKQCKAEMQKQIEEKDRALKRMIEGE